MLLDTTTSHVATQLGIRGVNYAIVSACASGTVAIGEAAEVIRRDEADAILAGGTESAIVPLILAGFCAMRAPGRRARRPDRGVAAVRRHPRRLRDGRGRGRCWMLEELEHARARGARIYCEVLGYGASNDAYHVATPTPVALGVIAMMDAALKRRERRARRDRLHQRPRHLDAATTTPPRRWPSRRSSATTPTSWRSRRPSR